MVLDTVTGKFTRALKQLREMLYRICCILLPSIVFPLCNLVKNNTIEINQNLKIYHQSLEIEHLILHSSHSPPVIPS